MPIYEYLCKACGNRFDLLRPMTEADKSINCTSCNSCQTRRLISTCYARSDSRQLSTRLQSCSSCSGGSCATCHS